MRILIIVFSTLLFVVSQAKLVKSHDRVQQNVELNIEEIRMETQGYSVEDIIVYACNKTADDLTFTRKNDLRNYKANCVGYAQYSSAIANVAFENNNYHVKAKPVVGCYHFMGINIHKILTTMLPDNSLKSFVKDHDYVEIIDADGEVVISFDPSIYDLTGLHFSE